MPRLNVAYFSGIGGRSEFMIVQALLDLEVAAVDPRLPDEERSGDQP